MGWRVGGGRVGGGLEREGSAGPGGGIAEGTDVGLLALGRR